MSLLMRKSPSSRFVLRRLGAFVAVAAIVAACVASPASASERGKAERLYTKGLAELHAGNGEAAVKLFDQAVAADPKDVRGLYYRALGNGHLGRYDAAVADLRIVVAANDAAIERDRLELGYALFKLEKYDEAAVELELATKKGRNPAEAYMMFGIVETRRGNHDAARAALAKVENLDPQRAVPARYYPGLAAYRAGDNDTAVEQFTWVSTNGGDSPYAREAAEFLERIEDGGTKPYRLYAGLAFEYDSNVALAPDDDIAANTLGVSDEDDGRAVITAGGQFLAAATSNFHLSLGYDFLQTLHFDLDEFNVQTHRIGGQGEYFWGPVSLGLAAGYEHSFLDDESLLDGGTVLPWIRVDEGALGYSEFYYRMRARDYTLSPYSPQRDSVNHAVGARQFFSLGSRDRNIIVGYRYDNDIAMSPRVPIGPNFDDPLGNQWDYSGHQFEAGLGWAFDEDLRAAMVYAYKLENYSEASATPLTTDGRDDDEHQVITRIEKRVHEYIWVAASYIFVANESDQSAYDYTRHITSLGVEARY
jgi:tetratricopeptide (TPR) repeat protein